MHTQYYIFYRVYNVAFFWKVVTPLITNMLMVNDVTASAYAILKWLIFVVFLRHRSSHYIKLIYNISVNFGPNDTLIPEASKLGS